MTPMDAFLTIQQALPRQGPGTPEEIHWALSFADRPARVLDAGCGKGADAVTLAQALRQAQILAVDTHAPFTDAAAQALAPFGARVRSETLDMAQAGGPFDLIWCNGALYFLGLTEGLATLSAKLSSGGILAFTEPCLFGQPTAAAVSLFEGYPLQTAEGIAAATADAGLEVLSQRPLPQAAWQAYYEPMQAYIEATQPTASAEMTAALQACEAEIAAWRTARADAGYLLTVARLP